ncbi:MAG: hypothetical protein IT379_35075, partial [Deltaproteobacteria bacterium]|nr:hypothetical protein [Deltaproteobacteria bacterium]
WRLLTREGEHVVETVLSAPSGHVRETRRYRAADVDATVAGSLARLGLRAPRELVVLGAPRGAGEGVVEVVELVHGPADRPGPGRIRWKGPAGHAAASSD